MKARSVASRVARVAAPAPRRAEVKLPYEPRAHQAEAHAARLRKRWAVLVWHRRAGKTVFSVIELILAALGPGRDARRYAYICPYLKQAKDVAWEYMKRFTRPIDGLKTNESELSIAFPNGSTIRLYGADHPDSLRGIYLDGVVLDETGQMKRVLWFEVIRPLLADRNGWALFIGTSKGINLFSEVYWAALKDNAWHADLKTWRDTGVIPNDEIESLRKAMSPQAFAQEFECDFHAAVENVLIPLERVQAAMERKLRPEAYNWAAVVVGADIARFGDDTTVVAVRQGAMLHALRQARNLDAMQAAAFVAAVAREYRADAIFIDVTGGLGAGPRDRLHELGFPAISVDFAKGASNVRYRNKRTEMWAEAGEWLKTSSIPADDQELVQDLVAPTYDFEIASGRMFLEPKADIKDRVGRSPDKGDALACTFFAPVAARDLSLPPGMRGRAGGQVDRAVTEYDPYASQSSPDADTAITEYDPYRS